MSIRQHLFALAAGILLSSPACPGVAGELVIDDFTTPQSGSGSVVGAGIVGGERDGSASGQSTLDIGAGSAVMTMPAGAPDSFILLDYDGVDGGAGVSYLLGGVDLTAGGSNDAFVLQVEELIGTARLAIRVAESSSAFVQLPLDIETTGNLVVPFADFPVNAGVDFTSVERVFVRITLDGGESILLRGIGTGTGDAIFGNGFED